MNARRLPGDTTKTVVTNVVFFKKVRYNAGFGGREKARPPAMENSNAIHIKERMT